MSLYIGFDPGNKGAMAAIFSLTDVMIWEFKHHGLIGYQKTLTVLIEHNSRDNIIIGLEKVHAMPGQGVTSMFNFGCRYGEIQGLLSGLHLGYELVRPQVWQKDCNVKPKSKKAGIHSAVSKIYPGVEYHGPRGGLVDGIADAVGIAHYMRAKYNAT